jgi:hypothetical protein
LSLERNIILTPQAGKLSGSGSRAALARLTDRVVRMMEVFILASVGDELVMD